MATQTAKRAYAALRGECLTVGDYHAIRKIIGGIPKRDRSKLKRRIKRYAMTVILAHIADPKERMKAYRRGWQAAAKLAAGEK